MDFVTVRTHFPEKHPRVYLDGAAINKPLSVRIKTIFDYSAGVVKSLA